ncbi:unnamed protein product [Umbelopsis ramanniana]
MGEDFEQDQILESLYVRQGLLGETNNGQRIKVTKEGSPRKGKGKVYIGGVQIVDKDIAVNNQSVVQVVSRLLTPPDLIVDVIKNWQKSDLYATLDTAKLLPTLNEPRPFTLFASSQETLQPFTSIERSYLLHELGNLDLQLYLKCHIVDRNLYASDFPEGETQVEALNGKKLIITVDKDSKIKVDDIPVSNINEMTANGAIHTLETSIVPSELIFTARKYLIGMNATKFVSLLDEYGLSNYIDDPNRKCTFLAPSNEAFEEVDYASGNFTKLLLYHILPQAWLPKDLDDGLLIDTELIEHKLDGSAQKLKVAVENEDGSIPMNLKPKDGKSITFGGAFVNGEPVEINGAQIYTISEVLTPPADLLTTLITDLDLSAYIASLYAAKTENKLKDTKGVTLFVPSNVAFAELGLAAKYLLHPDAKFKLATVIYHHAIPSLVYSLHFSNITSMEYQTLAGTTLQLNRTTESNQITVGNPDNTITNADILLVNGVAHKVNGVVIPPPVEITNSDLLKAAETSTFSQLLKVVNLTQILPSGNFTILAPSDKAFGRLNVTQLLLDPTQLLRIMELHILKSSHISPFKPMVTDNTEYESLLSDNDKVLFKEIAAGQYIVEVKGGKVGNMARVVAVGKATTGGGVVEIDSVLIPVPRGWAGLSLVVKIAVVVSSILGLVAIAVISYFIWKCQHRRRLGYVELSN